MKIAIFIIAIFLCASAASAGEIYGSSIDLLKGCKSLLNRENNERAAYCAGFVRGVVETARGIASLEDLDKEYKKIKFYWHFCEPQEVTKEQDIRIFVKYLEDHPEKLNVDASLLLFESLREAFPCK